jgi:virulence-associated protein VagC
MRTRIFKSGNSLAVRIPRELGFDDTASDADIERRADCLIIRPVCTRSLSVITLNSSTYPMHSQCCQQIDLSAFPCAGRGGLSRLAQTVSVAAKRIHAATGTALAVRSCPLAR